ncbi:MAG: glycosyltransferase family 2 protein [Bacteroidia bacterium]|nr:glycosyltransferase family 2 protein [Bacteroidia bacterium]
MKNSDTLIIIPAYNEASNIIRLNNSLENNNNNWDILIINDASTDNTKKLAESSRKFFIINLPINLGIGGCVQTGFKFASKYDYDYVIQFDADGQHIIDEIPKLLNSIKTDGADVIIGSRFGKKYSDYKPSLPRRIGIKIFEIATQILIRQRITDSTSGFRAYNKQAIKFLAENYPIDYPEPEAVILLSKNNFIIKEIFIKMQNRQSGTSSISGKGAYYMLKVLLAMIMTAIRPRIIGSKQ